MKKAKKPRSKSPSKVSKRRKAAPKAAAAKKAAKAAPVLLPESPSPEEISSLDTKAIFQQNVLKEQSQFDIQSGDLEGLSRKEFADSESVEELADEGQDREGEIIEAIEEAPEPDQAEISVHKAPRPRPSRYKDRNRL